MTVGVRKPWLLLLATAVAMTTMIMGALAIWPDLRSTSSREPIEVPASEIKQLNIPVVAVVATGTPEAVCEALIGPYAPHGAAWGANVLGTGSDGSGGSWLFCDGERGSGIGTVAGRSSDNSQWITQILPIGHRNHAGDELRVDIGSQGRASLTFDSSVSTGHTHIWTLDGGTSWFGLLGYQ